MYVLNDFVVIFFLLWKVKQSNVTCELCHEVVNYVKPFVDSSQDKVINTGGVS